MVQHLDGFCIFGIFHNLISYPLSQHSCLARGVIVWPVILFFQFPGGLGVGFCAFPGGVLRALWLVGFWEEAHLGMWSLSYCDGMVWDRGRVWNDVPAILQRFDVVVFIVCHPFLFQLLVSSESFHWLGEKTSRNGQSSSFLCRRFQECCLVMQLSLVCS